MNPREEFEKLKAVFPSAQALGNGDRINVFLPKLPIRSNGKLIHRDVLLCPYEHGGYDTRLFLSEPVEGKGQNWSTHTLFTRNWHTWSWRYVSAAQAWSAILANHLAALA